MDVFDLQNKDEEHYSAMVGELVQRTWSSELTSKEIDSTGMLMHVNIHCLNNYLFQNSISANAIEC